MPLSIAVVRQYVERECECELESTGAGQGSVAGFCTYGNEHWGPVNHVAFRDQLTVHHVVVKTDNVLCSSHKNSQQRSLPNRAAQLPFMLGNVPLKFNAQ